MRTARIVFVLTLVLVPAAGRPATRSVLPDGSGEFATIQSAIDASASGDTVSLGDGIFTGTGNRDLDFGSKSLTLRSASGDPTACVIDAQASYADAHRGAHLHLLPNPGALLEGITFRGGYNSGEGGGVLADQCRLLARNCVFRDNAGAWWAGGGGLAVENGEAILEDCLFQDNQSAADFPWPGNGGGLYGHTSTIALTRCDFVGNHVRNTFDGGGMGGGATLVDCALTATDCAFRGNYVSGSNMGPGLGGALMVEDGTAAVSGCLFADNLAAENGEGGAIAILTPHPVSLTSCTIQHNGGAGAVRLDGGPLALDRCVLANNYQVFGVEVPGYAIAVAAGTVTLSACDIWGHSAGDWIDPIADQHFVRGNFSADPCFCDAAGGDFHLCADSACTPEHNPLGQDVLVGAYGVGCAACGCPAAVGVDDGGAVPRVTVLHGAVPNPFNPRTEIRFAIARAGSGELRIFDARGALVRTLVSGRFEAGEQSIAWDGRGDDGRAVASGVYFCRLSVGGVESTAKLALLR